MTGKRPRTLTRNPSVSQLDSELFSQEFSPLPEAPKEKLKSTIKERTPVLRVVFGFDPKPASDSDNGTGRSQCTKIPTESRRKEKAPSPRSGLGSLLSKPWGSEVSEGVGLGIVLHAPTPTPALEEITINILEREVERDHISIAMGSESSPSWKPRYTISSHQTRNNSHPIPIQVSGSCYSSCQTAGRQLCDGIKPDLQGNGEGAQHRAGRSTRAWLQQDEPELDRRDTFLLTLSSSKTHQISNNVVTSAVSAAVPFLEACCFCKRLLAEGKDIYMYRGDKAFCSIECREQQMLLDKCRENCSSAALKVGSVTPARRSRVVSGVTAVAA